MPDSVAVFKVSPAAEAGHPGPFVVSAPRLPEKWYNYWGDYTLTDKEHRRLVYKQSEGVPGYLYSLESGAWEVDTTLGSSNPRYRSTTAASSPDLCQQWQYSDAWGGGPPWKDGDITVSATK